MGDQRDFSLRLFGDNLQYLLSFSKALYECFPGGTANVQPVDTLADVKTHQTAQAFAIQLLLMIKWGQQRRHYALQCFCHTYLYG